MLTSDDVINADESNLTMLRHPFSLPSKNFFVQWHETSNIINITATQKRSDMWVDAHETSFPRHMLSSFPLHPLMFSNSYDLYGYESYLHLLFGFGVSQLCLMSKRLPFLCYSLFLRASANYILFNHTDMRKYL